MKKLFILFLCLVSLSLFSQNKKRSPLTYKKGKGYAKFYIPTEGDFVDGRELVIKEKKLNIIGLSFYKTTIDTLSYYVDVEYVGEKSLTDKLFEEITLHYDMSKDFNKCTNNNHPSFTLRAGPHIITIKRGNMVSSYKLNVELAPQFDDSEIGFFEEK